MNFKITIFIFSLTTLFSLYVFSQNAKIDDTKSYLQAKSYEKAKEAIDAAGLHQKTKDQIETWYLKGLVYNALGNEEPLRTKFPGAQDTAFEAFKKAYKISNNDFLKYVLTYNGGTNPILFVYTAVYQQGVKLYNEKKFIDAANMFKKALTVNDYVAELPQGNRPHLDTSLIINIASCYENAGDKIAAAPYYEEVANTKASAESYSAIYRWLCYHYYKVQPDTVKLNKYLYIGKKLFPKDDLYAKIELDRARNNQANVNKEELFDKYEASLAQSPKDLDILKTYASDLFLYIHPNNNKRPENVADKAARLEELYQLILELETEKKHDIHIECGKHYYNEYLFASENIKPFNMKLNALREKKYNIEKSKKKDPKTLEQKKETELQLKSVETEKENIKIKANEILDEAIKHLEKGYQYYDAKFTTQNIKAYEKNIFKGVVDLLIICSQDKKDKVKEALYDKKYSDIK